MDQILLGKAALDEAQRLQRRLAGQGISLTLIHNQATCSRGCAIQVELWAAAPDVAEIHRLLGEDRARMFASMGYDARLADEVFDPSQATAVCPACGTSFATDQGACPECGLCFDAAPGGGGHGCR